MWPVGFININLRFFWFGLVRSIRVEIKSNVSAGYFTLDIAALGLHTMIYSLWFTTALAFFYGLNKRTPYPDLLSSSLSNEDLRVSVPQDKEGSLDERPNYWDPAPIFDPFFFLGGGGGGTSKLRYSLITSK